MSAYSDGGPAFPIQDPDGGVFLGMTIRDWFAGMALQTFLHSPDRDPECIAEDYASAAYEVADAMLEKRPK